ncbi:glycosyltransferase [Devosia sp. 919]|uniref:glycosyltransferase family 8 protein n=1 Tax=Devosia sp. 919 TaxID=2726065 RepID=UPI0015547B17|nr:glycosyltransferase [Devosia sp. 919]
MTTETAFVMISDVGFLVPSLVLARQISSRLSPGLADILLFTINLDAETQKRLTEDFAGELRVLSLPDQLVDLPASVTFKESHVPRAAMARLLMYQFVPEQYQNVIYIDGDMQVAGDLTSLANYRVPDGEVLAVAENFIVLGERLSDLPKWCSTFLSNLKLERTDDYFNSGLLAFRRETWKEIGPRAWKFFLEHSEVCEHHDQSALNAVLGGRWRRASPSFNFNSHFALALPYSKFRPNLIHFTSAPKPWAGASLAWPIKLSEPYVALVKQYAYLRATIYMDPLLKRSAPRRAIRDIKRRFLARSEIAERRRRFFEYLARSRFDVS